MFNILNIELTSLCNKDCWMCGRRKIDKEYPELKIEYGIRNKEHKLEDLTSMLKNAGFNYVIYRTNPFHRISNKKGGNIYGEKEDLFKNKLKVNEIARN